MRHAYQLAPPVAFFHLAVDQTWLHPPPAHSAPALTHLEPLPKMSGQCIKVQIQAIAREEWNAARSHELSQGMDDAMGHVLCSGAELKHRKNYGARINAQPEPLHLPMAAQPRAQFVELEVREPKMAEGPLVQGLRVLASTSQPGGNGGLSQAE